MNRPEWSAALAIVLGLLSVAVALLAPSTLSVAPMQVVVVVGGVDRASPLAVPSVGLPPPPLTLRTLASPLTICAFGDATCPAQVGTARVSLTATSTAQPTATWPNVEVAFVIETTAYDGVYWHYFGYPGTDACADANGGTGLPCEESNGVPFFMDHAQQIADGISRANPHSKVSFALVDFFGTDCGDWNDCGDSTKYHVDIPEFVPAADFGTQVTATLKDQVFGGSYAGIVGLDDNFLHSPSITALYGAIIGSGLDWSANTHHVIVLMGSTAPRAPGYVENYAVSPFDACCGGTQPEGWVCEPAYPFGSATMPQCEGWAHSEDGNVNDSIAGLTRSSPTCTDSIGGRCTVDVIDLWTTPTDPYSRGWPVGRPGGGPGGTIVQANTQHVIEAGCDMTAATGGTWDGPAFDSCPDGTAGTLQLVPHGSYDHPNTQNPSLLRAMTNIGFGPVYQTLVANGTIKPIFHYVPFGAIEVSGDPQFAATCARGDGTFLPTCQRTPFLSTLDGVQTLSWNWSTDPKQNTLHTGDTWTASFNVVANGPPYARVPVDSCSTAQCTAGGSAPVAGEYTWATYRPYGNQTVLVQSFPLASVTVEITPALVSGVAPPPPGVPAPPGIPLPVAPPVPALVPVVATATVGIANVSVQATAAGVLAAAFLKVSMKNKPIALRVAAKAGPQSSKFDQASADDSRSTHVGRFD